jgi:uncharacterized protein YbjT (DUF2867 family)
VSALVRAGGPALPEGVRVITGDVLEPADVERAVAGQEAVIVTLGIRENPLRVRLLGPARTPLDVRSRGTRLVIEALRRQGVRRLVVQTSYGVGETRERLRLVERLLFALLLRPQIADTELQEREVRESGLDWSLIQPVHLTDGQDSGMPHLSASGETGEMKVSRRSVGRALAAAVSDRAYVGQSLAVSGAA